MRSKTASGIMLTLFVAIMLTAALDPIPVLAETEGWVPYVPSCSVDLESWTATDQKTNVKVTLTLPQPCFIFDWGTVTKSGYDIWADSKIWKWTGPCATVIQVFSYIYDLGFLEEGNYTFTFRAWNSTIKSVCFQVTELVGRSIRIINAKTGLNSTTLGNQTEPIPSEGYPFAINVTLDGVTNYLNSFQVAIAFDKTKVKCAAAWIPEDDQNFVFYEENPSGSASVYNNLGLVALSSFLVPLPFRPVFGGNYVNVSETKLLCQLNFTTIEVGTSVLEMITEPLYFPTWNTVLTDLQNNTIDFTTKAFSVTVVGLQPPPLSTDLSLRPHVLNLRSKGKWVTAYIELPEGYEVGDINRTTILLNDTIPVDPFWPEKPLESVVGDFDNDTIPDLMVKFSRAAVIDYLINQNIKRGNITLTLTGELFEGAPFEGSDMIKVKMSESAKTTTPDEVDSSNENVIVMPEFASFLVLPLFLITTLLAVLVYRRKHSM